MVIVHNIYTVYCLCYVQVIIYGSKALSRKGQMLGVSDAVSECDISLGIHALSYHSGHIATGPTGNVSRLHQARRPLNLREKQGAHEQRSNITPCICNERHVFHY